METYTEYLERTGQLEPDNREKLWRCTGCGEYYTEGNSIIPYKCAKDDRFYTIVGKIHCDCYKEERESRFWKHKDYELYYYYLPYNNGSISVGKNKFINYYSSINKIEIDYILIEEEEFMQVYNETLENFKNKLKL